MIPPVRALERRRRCRTRAAAERARGRILREIEELSTLGCHGIARAGRLLAAAVSLGAWVVSASALAQGPAPSGRDLALIAAAGRGDTDAVRRLLVEEASVQAADARGVTALIAAAYGNHVQVAELLVRAGADVNRQDVTQQSAFLIATSDGYLELLRLTLANGADVHRTDSYNGTGLIRAADRGHVEIIRELLKTGIKLDHVNRLGWTALLEAIILGNGGARHTEVVRLLVAAGANVNLPDGSGVSPFAHARQRGFTAIVRVLEQAGAR